MKHSQEARVQGAYLQTAKTNKNYQQELKDGWQVKAEYECDDLADVLR